MKPHNKIKTLLRFSLAMLIMFAFVKSPSEAQPTNYCNPTAPTGLTAPIYYYCWPAYYNYWYGYTAYYGALIQEVSVYDSQNNLLMDNPTSTTQYNKIGTTDCYEFFNSKLVKVSPGETYDFRIKARNIYGYAYSGYDYTSCTSYYYTVRLFIDWNADGTWTNAGEWINDPSGANPNPTFWAYRSTSRPSTNDCPNPTVYDFMVKIPDNVNPATARFRVQVGYYYPSSPNQEVDYGWAKFYNSGKNPCINGYANDYYNYGYSYVYSRGETEDYLIEYQLPIKETFPSDKAPNDILNANVAYDGTNGNPKPYVTFYSPNAAGVQMQFNIVGPMPVDSVVYKAIDPVTGSDWVNIAGLTSYSIQKAVGLYALNGDGTFKSASGGVYKLTVVIRKPGSPDRSIMKSFTVSWPNDLSVVGIISPRAAGAPDYFQYPRQTPIALSIQYQNVGIYDVTKFLATIQIYNPDGTLNGTYTKLYDTANGDKVLHRKDQALVTMDQSFSTDQVGLYKIVAKCTLLSSGQNGDDEAYNDVYARPGDPSYYLSIQYEYQAAATKISFPTPTSDVIIHRPFNPVCQITNKGLSDLSNISVTFTYYPKNNPSDIHTNNVFIKAVSAGTTGNVADAYFPSMVIDQIGDYHGIFHVSAPGDGYPNDDVIEGDFTVEPGLSGTYTIGTKYAGNANNFNTIELATDALFLKGLSGNVSFEFTDDSYDIYSAGLDQPAWDLSSAILGLGYDAQADVYRTITFKPSADKAASRSTVTINLHAQNGKGIMFGQSSSNMNPFAIINSGIEPNKKGAYVNNGGYITFDGGSQKSLKFNIISSEPNHASVFYLGRGSHNITIKNCLIENGTESTYNLTWIPRVSYNSADGFMFQNDVTTTLSGIQGYSAGIVNRASISNSSTEKAWGVSALTNDHNVFEANEIKNFGYGIMSIGIGANLNSSNMFYSFYNNSNVIKSNIIDRVAGAGIFVGFEENTDIAYNKIYKVNGANTGYAILSGLSSTTNSFGYNNVNLHIYGNQISEIKGTKETAGIKFYQSQLKLANSDGTAFIIPEINDNVEIYSNAIWDIRAFDNTTNRAGIYVTTERADESNPQTPSVPDHFINGALVANNTVIMEDDGIDNQGTIAGIAIQNTKKLTIANNAIAVLDTKSSGQGGSSAVFYQGLEPTNDVLTMDHNAYYIANGSTVARYIQIDANSNIVEAGYPTEYQTLDQWRLWTGKDLTSNFGYNFINDFNFTGIEPVNITMKSNPAPKGSVLNNRGLILSDVKTDMFGQTRGDQGQSYDIGAIEFVGQAYINDLESYGIILQGVKEESAPMDFSDAFYEMTNPPVNFVGRIYNGGANTQSSIPVTINIQVKNPDGTFSNVLSSTEVVPVLNTSNFVDVDFKLSDGIGTEFSPKTYYELNQEREAQGLSIYTVPDKFAPMAANVTPIYRVTISLPTDENNNNNNKSIDFRYYVRRSPIGLMTISNSDLTPISATPTIDEIATKANKSALDSALKNMGWYTDYTAGRFDIDYLYLSGWMPKSLDFTPYNSIMWSDGDYEQTGGNLSVYQIDALGKFLDAGKSGSKKNLVIASQEIARLNRTGLGQQFLNNYMKLNNNYPSNPFGLNGNYDGNTIKGMVIAKNLETTIQSTGIAGDDYPKPALLMITNDIAGQSNIGYIYTKLEQGKNGENDVPPYPNSERIMSVVTSTIGYNSIYLGVDWRHFGRVSDVVRGLSDYIEYNGGNLLPVELSNFDAVAAGKRVDISWITSSETNSSTFEVQKANVGSNDFATISVVPAKGRSVDETKYGPVNDFAVEYGHSYVYRLKMTDKDGSVSYSNEKIVEIRGEVGFVQLGEVLPNPSINDAQIELSLGNDMNVDLSLFDMNGRKVQTILSGSQNSGTQHITINTKELSSGTYTLILKAGDVLINRNFQVVK
jgi:hypothetical protein